MLWGTASTTLTSTDDVEDDGGGDDNDDDTNEDDERNYDGGDSDDADRDFHFLPLQPPSPDEKKENAVRRDSEKETE